MSIRKFKDLMEDMTSQPKSRGEQLIEIINKEYIKIAQEKANKHAGYKNKSHKPSSSTKCIRDQVMYFLGVVEEEDANNPDSIRVRQSGEDHHERLQTVMESSGVTWYQPNIFESIEDVGGYHRTEIKFKDDDLNISGKFDNEVTLADFDEDSVVEIKSIGDKKFGKLYNPPIQKPDSFDIEVYRNGAGTLSDWFKYWVQAQIYMWQRNKKYAIFLYVNRDCGKLKAFDIEFHQPTIDWYLAKLEETNAYVRDGIVPLMDHPLVRPLCSKYCRRKWRCNQLKAEGK